MILVIAYAIQSSTMINHQMNVSPVTIHANNVKMEVNVLRVLLQHTVNLICLLDIVLVCKDFMILNRTKSNV